MDSRHDSKTKLFHRFFQCENWRGNCWNHLLNILGCTQMRVRLDKVEIFSWNKPDTVVIFPWNIRGKEHRKLVIWLWAMSTKSFLIVKNMTRENLTLRKESVIAVLCHTIHSSKKTRNNYTHIERGKRLKNVVLIRIKMNKICKNRQGASFSLTKNSAIATLWLSYTLLWNGFE